MLIRKLEEIRGTDRSVSDKGWESSRMLLAEDGMGFSFHITTLRAGGEWTFHYQHHVEPVFVISGRGTVEHLATGERPRPHGRPSGRDMVVTSADMRGGPD